MRYASGTLAISETRDVPLLLQIRNCRFVTHEQLYELMSLASYEHSRNSFNWRIRRLFQANFVSVCQGSFGRGVLVYTISRQGLIQLENWGHFTAVLNSTTQHLSHVSQAHHALELNSVRIALTKAQLLANWRSDVEVASANTILPGANSKDYDALVDVWHDNQMSRFAVEYERTLKSAKRYKEVRQALERDTNIGCVLYLTSGVDVSFHLAHEFAFISKRLAFATISNFRRQLLETPVITDPHQPETPFCQLLRGMF